MKIVDLFQDSQKKLKDLGILTYKLDAKILISYLLNINSKDLILYLQKEIDEDFIKIFNTLLNRRINREPIANIIEKKEFWNYEFYVNNNVLTPRNDSETLIHAILENFTDFNEELNILDLGSGSGCLVLTLLKLYQNSKGIAVDISDEALNIIKINKEKLNVKNLNIIKSFWNNEIDEKFDIIISNPPYIPKKEIDLLEDEVKIHNPLLALDGGDDGLDCYKYLAKNLYKNTKKNTKIFLEIGINQENDIIKIFEENNFKIKEIYKDLSGINRILYFISISN